jgi:hypothetical protein
MNRADAEIQERVDRLFDRFEHMTDAEFLIMRSAWDEQDHQAREDAWTMVKVALRTTKRDALLDDARHRIASWVNNYSTPMSMGDVPLNFSGSGMDPNSIRRAAIPPMLDAIAATIAADGLSAEDQALLLEPVTVMAR